MNADGVSLIQVWLFISQVSQQEMFGARLPNKQL
jgi:hypothetical protein